MGTEEKTRKMFEVLVAEHGPMLVSYLASMTESRQEAEDLAQDAFVKAYKSFESFEERGGGFASWLRRIGRNTMVDTYRRSKRLVVTDPEVLEGIEEVFSGADQLGPGDTWTERVGPLRECLTVLPERLRAVCTMHYTEELTAKAIGEKLGVTLSAVLKRLERSRRRLRECIEGKLAAV